MWIMGIWVEEGEWVVYSGELALAEPFNTCGEERGICVGESR